MKNNKEFKSLGVSDRMKVSEMLGAKVAIIMNKARDKANKILAITGHAVNVKVEFYRLEQPQPVETKEVTNG
jgi:hypothetical protein